MCEEFHFWIRLQHHRSSGLDSQRLARPSHGIGFPAMRRNPPQGGRRANLAKTPSGAFSPKERKTERRPPDRVFEATSATRTGIVQPGSILPAHAQDYPRAKEPNESTRTSAIPTLRP